MKAFHNKPEMKEEYLTRVRAHRKADEIIKGKYWEDGKGCAVGCTIHSSDHQSYETLLGIPHVIAILEDNIFEGLPNDLAMTWPERFLEAIPIGADLSFIWDRFAYRLLMDPLGGVIQYAKTEKTRKAILRVAHLYQDKISGIDVPYESFKNAAAAAAAHAAHAAYAAHAGYAGYAAAAADAAAGYAAHAGYAGYAADADAAAGYATTACYFAADAAAGYAGYAAACVAISASARHENYTFQSELLLELLKEAKH